MMLSDIETPMSLEEAQALLKQFDCLKEATIALNYSNLRTALLLVAQHSDYQMLGICAESIAQGTLALQQYTQALGYKIEPNLDAIDGSIYIKFNPKTALCYATGYDGHYRGVLVSCQSAYETGVNEMYGHLPLDLFALEG